MIELPTVFPIFPLDEVILVPGQLLPLHVFEPRYRAMVADALDGGKMIAMAMSEDGAGTGIDENPPVLSACGLGRIVHHAPYPDGRSDIVLEGLARMLIEEELDTDHPYRLVRANPFVEIEPKADVSERAKRLLVRARCFDEEERRAFCGMPLTPLLDSLLLRIPAPCRRKHEIFAERDLEARLLALEKMLDELEEPPESVCFEPRDPRLN